MRQDITLLRGFSVFAVVLYHTAIPLWSGGYLGVDIFFVISGFVITQSISRQVENRSFSYCKFWRSRSIRLMPALLVVVSLCSIFAFVLDPNALKVYSQSVIATVFFANNFLLYITSGYWTDVTQFKHLYHTWSLAVEAHFYILFPFIVVLCWKRKFTFVFVITCIFTVSFSAWIFESDIEKRFLLSPYRFWQLLVGVFFYFIHINNCKFKLNFYLGTCLLVAVMALSSVIGQMWGQFFSVMLTGLLLCRENILKPNFLLRIIGLVGLSSYSIYLWHQPLLAYVRYLSEAEPSNSTLLLTVFVSLFLGFATYGCIETQVKNRLLSNFPHTKIYLSIITILVVVSLFSHYSFGFEKYRTTFQYGGDPIVYVEKVFELQEEALYQSSSPRIVIIGNSFARDFANILSEHPQWSSFAIAYRNMSCAQALKDHFELLRRADIIFLAQNFGDGIYSIDFIEQLKLCRDSILSAFDADFLIIGGKNFGWSNGFISLIEDSERASLYTHPNSNVVAFNRLANDILSPNFFDPFDYLMNDEGEVPITTPDGKIIAFDTNHLTPAGAKFLANIFLENISLPSMSDRSIKLLNGNEK